MKISKAKTFEAGTDFDEVAQFMCDQVATKDPENPEAELKTVHKYKIQITLIHDNTGTGTTSDNEG